LHKTLLVVLVLLCCLPARSQSLQATVEKAIAEPPFDRALWAIRIEESDGTPLYSGNAHTLFIPASNRKLFAAAAVANCLGWDRRFQTELRLDGEDLVIRGGGDPSLGGRYSSSWLQALDPFVGAARARGLRSVRDVVADVSLFDRTTVPGSWKVGNLPYYYAARVDALTLAENVDARGAVPDPALSAAQSFRDALTAAGIQVTGKARVCEASCETPGHSERLASIESPYVSQLLSTVLENSQNLYTEVLLKDLSLPAGSEPGTAPPPPASYESSLAIERRFLVDEVGVDPAEFRFVDGSGLSADDLVTSSAVVQVLRWMNAPERRGKFWSVMSTPGNTGTLHHRLVDLASRLRGKTGTLGGVNALSGFVIGRNGGCRYFSIIVNHHTGDSDEAERIIDSIVTALSDF
jgi:D-alanyl-D-alanine carboxypeptidase/D-alanyl-D-alanine-endopeptidase (penicillin-binding protein 4)